MLTAPAFCSAADTTFPFADNKKSVLGIDSWKKTKPLDSAKAARIKDGMTLKALVEALGPGWVTLDDGVGIIRWSFKNNRTLSVWPKEYNESEIIPMKMNNRHNRPCMWWSQ